MTKNPRNYRSGVMAGDLRGFAGRWQQGLSVSHRISVVPGLPLTDWGFRGNMFNKYRKLSACFKD